MNFIPVQFFFLLDVITVDQRPQSQFAFLPVDEFSGIREAMDRQKYKWNHQKIKTEWKTSNN